MKDCQQKASSFLIKLLNMLRSKQNAKTITWDAQQSGIRIFNQQKLEEFLLPRYFRHNRYSSFVRQLNMYDFHKIYLQDGASLFYHEIFNPRDKQSVYKIKRKAPPINDQNNQLGKFDQNNKNSKGLNHSLKIQKNQNNTFNREEASVKSSFKLLFKNSSVGSSNERSEEQKQTQQILEEIIAHIAPLKLSEESIRQKISQLRKYSKFNKFLKRSSFLRKIYAKLGIQMDHEDDKLSELSIEQQLMFNTKKSLTLRSLKMFESGPINLKDTLGMFLS